MIGQTCQKCGQTCTTDEYIVGIGRDEVGCSLYIGEWSRTWALCDGCARALQRYIAGFFEPVEAQKDWLNVDWIPADKDRPLSNGKVFLKMADESLAIGYFEGGDWWKVAPSPRGVFSPEAVKAWAPIPGLFND